MSAEYKKEKNRLRTIYQIQKISLTEFINYYYSTCMTTQNTIQPDFISKFKTNNAYELLKRKKVYFYTQYHGIRHKVLRRDQNPDSKFMSSVYKKSTFYLMLVGSTKYVFKYQIVEFHTQIGNSIKLLLAFQFSFF